MLGGTPFAKADDSDLRDKDTCQEFAKEFYQLQMPGEGQFMPRFLPMPLDLPSPGPLPNGAIAVPRRTKCWIAAQIGMGFKYPAIAEAITLALLEEQKTYYEKELTKKSLKGPAIGAAVGLILGISMTFFLVRK